MLVCLYVRLWKSKTLSIDLRLGLSHDFFQHIVCVFCLHICLCDICISGTYRGQKREFDFLNQDLQMVINLHVSAGSQRLQLLSHLSSTLIKWYFFSFRVLKNNSSQSFTLTDFESLLNKLMSPISLLD